MNRLKAANAITSSRIVFALLILFAPVFSVPFYVFYFLGAATDMADGIIARKLNQESSFGAKLDTVADLVFVIAVLIKIVMKDVYKRQGKAKAEIGLSLVFIPF